MIVLILTLWHAITELSLPSWQKEVRNIAHEVVEAMKEAKNMEMMFVMHEIFCLVITNLNLHTEYLISLQKHLNSMFLRASRRILAKENRQDVVDSCSS